MIHTSFLARAVLVLLLLCPVGEAQAGRNRSAGPSFTSGDEKIIREYFAAYPGDPDPISADAPQPTRGERLRSGIGRRPLPRELAIRLKPVTKGYGRVIVDNDILIVATKTGTIADVILDAW